MEKKKWKVRSFEELGLSEEQKNDKYRGLKLIPDARDPYIREREKDREEKMMESLKMASINAVKWGSKIKKKLGKKKKEKPEPEKKKPSHEEDREKFRRLVSFMFREEFIEEFISIMQALNFSHLGGFEHFGRRDCDYSLAVDVDEKHRLHLRVYILKKIVFVLAHHEPKATEDVALHVKGFFDRVLSETEEEESKAQDPDHNNPRDELGRMELSNYELGSDILLDVLKNRVPNFYKKIEKGITEELLELWGETLGEIDHISDELLLIENLIDSSLYIPPFENIRNTAKKIFEYFDFLIEPVWHLNYPVSDQYFLAKTTYGTEKFSIFVLTIDYTDEIMRLIGQLRGKYKPDYVIVVVPDVIIDGPGEVYYLPDDVEPPEIDPDAVSSLTTFLKDQGVSVLRVSLVTTLFKMHLENPLRPSDFAHFLSNAGLVEDSALEDLKKYQQEKRDLIDYAKEIFNLFRKEKELSIKNIIKTAEKKNWEVSKKEITQILAFMENPLIQLIEPTDIKRKNYILPEVPDVELNERLAKMEKFLEEYLLKFKK